MKERILILILLFGSFIYGQSSDDVLKTIRDKWELDDNGNISIIKIIEYSDLSKDEIYNRALNYFIYNYVSGKSVIQNQDKDSGILIGKGFYDNASAYYGTWHILRIDVKDGKVRAIVTLTDYEKKNRTGFSTAVPSPSVVRISSQYPVNKQARKKDRYAEAFYKSYYRAINTLDKFEKALKEGNTSKSIENTTW